MNPSAGAVILAAGASRRMGRPKLPLDLHGRPVLQWVMDCAVNAGLDPVVVVGGDSAQIVELTDRPDVLRVGGGASQGASLAAGLGALPERCDRAVILLGDMPLVTERTVHELLKRQAEPGCDAAAADHGDVPGPPLVVHRSLFAPLAAGVGPARQAVLRSLGPRLTLVPVGAHALLDVDTPSDYRRVARTAAASGASIRPRTAPTGGETDA